MRWLRRLASELTARGVRGRDRRRILLELADHIACEPGGEERLGDPGELASTFADELATDGARRGAFRVFGALAATAFALVASQLALGSGIGYPGFEHGLSLALFIPALLSMFIGPQVALVAGTLATWRALRRRRARILPGAEIALLRRRTWVALAAGIATVAGLELYVIDFVSVLPAWWLALTGGLAALAGAALIAAGVQLARGGEIMSGTPGPAGDVFDDLGPMRWAWLRGHPWRLGAVASLSVGTAFTLFEARAEHSLTEGLQRGIFEGLVAAIGFVLVGRAIGATGPRARPSLAGLGLSSLPADRLVADEERSQAELVLRESFAQGRLDLGQLTARLQVIHRAQTIGQVRDALAGLPTDDAR
jgi:hypothetical protein